MSLQLHKRSIGHSLLYAMMLHGLRQRGDKETMHAQKFDVFSSGKNKITIVPVCTWLLLCIRGSDHHEKGEKHLHISLLAL